MSNSLSLRRCCHIAPGTLSVSSGRARAIAIGGGGGRTQTAHTLRVRSESGSGSVVAGGSSHSAVGIVSCDMNRRDIEVQIAHQTHWGHRQLLLMVLVQVLMVMLLVLMHSLVLVQQSIHSVHSVVVRQSRRGHRVRHKATNQRTRRWNEGTSTDIQLRADCIRDCRYILALRLIVVVHSEWIVVDRRGDSRGSASVLTVGLKVIGFLLQWTQRRTRRRFGRYQIQQQSRSDIAFIGSTQRIQCSLEMAWKCKGALGALESVGVGIATPRNEKGIAVVRRYRHIRIGSNQWVLSTEGPF